MKLKFVLVLLVVLGFAVGCYADCSKDEILKLIDKGFTKTEINGICGKSEPKKKKSKWITPSDSVCKSNGGNVDSYSGCFANWKNAKKICYASGGRLPTIDELKKVVTDCGGEMKDNNYAEYKRNRNNSSYQSCYKEKGFFDDYWSASFPANQTYDGAWNLYFTDGSVDYNLKSDNYLVRCVREGQ